MFFGEDQKRHPLNTDAYEGFYYVPRIDRKVIQESEEDIIVLSGN
jgi:hypothetical protein